MNTYYTFFLLSLQQMVSRAEQFNYCAQHLNSIITNTLFGNINIII